MKNKTNTIPSDVINYLVDYHDQFGVLPTNYIECNVTGQAYTCFGSNLKNKIEKAGGLKELLTSFIGRGAKKEAKEKVDQVIEKVKEEIKATKAKSPRKPTKVSIITEPATA